jgi:hypothetical protein
MGTGIDTDLMKSLVLASMRLSGDGVRGALPLRRGGRPDQRR